MKVFITGGAGFIGRNLTSFLLQKGYAVVVYDKSKSSKDLFNPSIVTDKNFSYVSGDVLDSDRLSKSMKGASHVYHLSANADVRGGLKDKTLDLTQGTQATLRVLDAMKKNGVNNIVFPSSMTVYGSVSDVAVAEDYGPCLPISLYGASKLASEGLISAYCHSFGMKSWIFRFANVVGSGLTHGVIFDLINKLYSNPQELKVLGDGSQTKPYIYIEDLLHAIDYVVDNTNKTVNLFNIGVETTASVKEIVKTIIEKMKLSKVHIHYDKTPHGWVGDVPSFTLSIKKLKQLGYNPRYTALEAISKTIDMRLIELSKPTS